MFNTVLEILAGAIRLEKEFKGKLKDTYLLQLMYLVGLGGGGYERLNPRPSHYTMSQTFFKVLLIAQTGLKPMIILPQPPRLNIA